MTACSLKTSGYDLSPVGLRAIIRSNDDIVKQNSWELI